jgi:hypothetical protein
MIAQSLFSRDGRLRQQFLTRDMGTGVFGPELGHGSFAIICSGGSHGDLPYFEINEPWRGRGIGTWALQELFKHKVLRVRARFHPSVYLMILNGLAACRFSICVPRSSPSVHNKRRTTYTLLQEG